MDPRPLLQGHTRDLGGGFVVRRRLPSAQRLALGPLLFFGHFGPVTVYPGGNHGVRRHPHIGLATVTCLFEGATLHHDCPGAVQRIEPGFAHTPASAIPVCGCSGATARVALIGGQPLGWRFMVCNSASSRKEHIVQAQDDWRAQRFDRVPDESDCIPLPQGQNLKLARQAWPTAS